MCGVFLHVQYKIRSLLQIEIFTEIPELREISIVKFIVCKAIVSGFVVSNVQKLFVAN